MTAPPALAPDRATPMARPSPLSNFKFRDAVIADVEQAAKPAPANAKGSSINQAANCAGSTVNKPMA